MVVKRHFRVPLWSKLWTWDLMFGPSRTIGVSVLYPLSEIRVTIKGSLLILELHFQRKGQELQISQKVFVYFRFFF